MPTNMCFGAFLQAFGLLHKSPVWWMEFCVTEQPQDLRISDVLHPEGAVIEVHYFRLRRRRCPVLIAHQRRIKSAFHYLGHRVEPRDFDGGQTSCFRRVAIADPVIADYGGPVGLQGSHGRKLRVGREGDT
jgi:hypothetical protein